MTPPKIQDVCDNCEYYDPSFNGRECCIEPTLSINDCPEKLPKERNCEKFTPIQSQRIQNTNKDTTVKTASDDIVSDKTADAKIQDTSQICECGHKRKEHNQFGTECYVIKHIVKDNIGSHYQCVCKSFTPKSVKTKQIGEGKE